MSSRVSSKEPADPQVIVKASSSLIVHSLRATHPRFISCVGGKYAARVTRLEGQRHAVFVPGARLLPPDDQPVIELPTSPAHAASIESS